MRLGRPWAVLALLCVSCSESSGPSETDPLTQLQSTGPLPLSPGNLAGQDEDPAILVARDGSLFAAWYSNRLGLHPSGRERKEIFVARSTDGATWSDPVAATSDAEWSFYPSLAQSADGVFHLAWMRWHLLPDGCVPGGSMPCTGTDRRIFYNRSTDGLHWTLADEMEIASGPADELANVVAASDGRLLVYYASGYRSGDPVQEIWVVVHDDAWNAPAAVTGIESAVHHDTFPNVAERAPGDFLMTWTRYDLADSLFSLGTQTMLSTSADGLSWTAPVALSSASASKDVFPHLYPDHARQNWFVVWVTESGTLDLRIGGSEPPAPIDIPGYTPRVLPTATPGIYWAAWAEGTEPIQKVRYRFLAK
jgi:hypothetical protein